MEQKLYLNLSKAIVSCNFITCYETIHIISQHCPKYSSCLGTLSAQNAKLPSTSKEIKTNSQRTKGSNSIQLQYEKYCFRQHQIA